MKKRDLVDLEILEDKIGPDEFSDIEEVEELLRTLPASSKSYLKIYKTKPLPVGTKPQFKNEITEIHLIEDLEVHIRNLAQENDWGPGEYLIVVVSKERDKDKRKIIRPIRINIDYDKPLLEKKESSNLKEKLFEMKELASSLKDLSPINNPPLDLSKTLAETFNKGMDTVKDLMKDTNRDDNSVLKIITALKEVGAVGNKESKGSSVLETLAIFKELGVLKSSNGDGEDFFNRLAKFKELGIIKTGEEDPLTTVNKIKGLVEVLTPLMGGNTLGGGNSSPLLELIRAIGPQVPKMVEHIMGGINNIADVIKIKAGVYQPPVTSLPKKEDLPVTPLKTISTKEENPMMSQKFLDLLYSYIKENDQTKFEEIASFVTLISGDSNFIWNVKSGTVPSSTLVNAILLYGGEKFQEVVFKEKIPAYVDQFILYIKAKEFIAICDKCKKEFDFFAKENFEASDKECQSEDCDGILKVK